MTARLPVTTVFLALAVFALPCIGNAQDSATSASTSPPTPVSHVAPLYSSDQDIGRVRSSSFNSPESDGRPGIYYFELAAQAVKHKDYAHAIAMYKVAASWAYKPAEYNLAVMYLRGQGTAVDEPRALAWMALAAQRNDPHYVKARDLINAHLNDAQFKQANVIMAQLLPTFGDKVALARAESRWREARNSETGSHVGGGTGPLAVGGVDGDANHMRSAYYDVHDGSHSASSGAEVIGGPATDGAIAYQQLRESNNPYDPKFEWHPDATGAVKVGPLQPLKGKDAVRAKKTADDATNGTGNPF